MHAVFRKIFARRSMTREVLSLHIGQCGCNVGLHTWRKLFEEHTCDKNIMGMNSGFLGGELSSKNEMPSAFFYESEDGTYKPRSVLIDTDPHLSHTVSHECRSTELNFEADSVLSYKQDCRANYFEGLMKSRELGIVQDVTDQLLNQADRSDSVGGFLVYRSLGGGTGSGVGTRLLESVRDTFGPKSVIFEPLVFPSTDSSTASAEPYNCVFGLASGRNVASLSLMLDNEAVGKFGGGGVSVSHLNGTISRAISECTSTLRFPSSLNSSLDQIVTNLVPDPIFRYPIVSMCSSESEACSELVRGLFDPKNSLCLCPNLKLNRYFAATVIARTASNAETHLAQIQRSLNRLKEELTFRKNPVKFVPWIGNSFKIGLLNNTHNTNSVLLLANTTGVRTLFLRQYEKFLNLYYHKAYVWQFLEAGGELDDFHDATENLHEMLHQYESTLSAAAVEEVANLRTAASALPTSRRRTVFQPTL